MRIKFSIHYLFTFMLLLVLLIACNNTQKLEKEPTSQGVHKITSEKEFEQVVAKAGKNLIVLDLYADWCGPCKMLSPVMEKIAIENKTKAFFYKINIDELKDIAAAFKTNGIPYVVFIKENKVINALIGLYPEEEYIKMINDYTENKNNSTNQNKINI